MGAGKSALEKNKAELRNGVLAFVVGEEGGGREGLTKNDI